jgi:hypothetical protein
MQAKATEEGRGGGVEKRVGDGGVRVLDMSRGWSLSRYVNSRRRRHHPHA